LRSSSDRKIENRPPPHANSRVGCRGRIYLLDGMESRAWARPCAGVGGGGGASVCWLENLPIRGNHPRGVRVCVCGGASVCADARLRITLIRLRAGAGAGRIFGHLRTSSASSRRWRIGIFAHLRASASSGIFGYRHLRTFAPVGIFGHLRTSSDIDIFGRIGLGVHLYAKL
jgi:hypothetical protein